MAVLSTLVWYVWLSVGMFALILAIVLSGHED